EAITCALEATGFVDAIRNAVSLGGDADTLAAIAGSIAEPLYGVPADVESNVMAYLHPVLIDTLSRFREKTRR
ncbi:MAG: ADP-ribosylglycohydrolase family protein, partial [Propionibacteriaceae bacterium]|nr:ADP-ribosylglycohydrolase family protein [Propionibacteriaceae bacterium]